MEDFCEFLSSEVVVSATIHKAKGREFDDVYMLLTDNYTKNAELKRRYYVGITRAKNRLFIHTNGHCFDRLTADRHNRDDRSYTMPEEIVLQLSHRDVYLEFSRESNAKCWHCRAVIRCNTAISRSIPRKRTSPWPNSQPGCKKTLTDWFAKGYRVKSATVSFIVAWKPKGSPEGGAGNCRLAGQPYPHPLIENPTLEEDDEKSLIFVFTKTK